MSKPVNLGCGDDYRHGWHNVDTQRSVFADEYADLDEYPWPWQDGEFSKALLDNVIEHLEDRTTALTELHRIVEPGGTVVVRFPHWNSPGHYTNPDHTKTIHRETFENYRLADLYRVESIDCTRVRFGRVLPKPVALWLSAHVGHLVSEVEVTATVLPGGDAGSEELEEGEADE